jgi:16S rRNA (cytosine967-C5)-methyltransferase
VINKFMKIDIPREIALKIIYDINENGAYSNISINKYLEGNELRDLDKGFITELVYGTVKWRLSLDWVIQQFSKIKLKKISPWILNILRLGVYQLLFSKKVPESAACNESVSLSKRYGHAASSKYVNGVLRNIARNKEAIVYPDKETDLLKYLSIKYSHPEWMVKTWLSRFGPDFTEGLLESNNKVPELIIRVNTLKTSKEALANSLLNKGIETENGKYVLEALVLKNPSSITKLEEFKNGYFQVQDESSMLVAKVLDPKPGELIIDVCSAPGGKATHIAQIMGDTGTVIARDIHPHKIGIISEAAKRLGLKAIKAEVFDATKLDDRYIEKADRVLVDAPCTGLGIIRRKPDIKWTRSIEDTSEIADLQSKILAVASAYVKPEGVLVYSTCTIQPEENEVIVKKFVNEHKEFELDNIYELLPEKLRKASTKEGFVQFYPNVDNIDGFFIARIKKRG